MRHHVKTFIAPIRRRGNKLRRAWRKRVKNSFYRKYGRGRR